MADSLPYSYHTGIQLAARTILYSSFYQTHVRTLQQWLRALCSGTVAATTTLVGEY